LLYAIDFAAGYSCGLFLDQRGNRDRLRQLAPSRCLNLFAFTCSFGLCGAVSGAETTNVDLAKGALERGRCNYRLNGIAPQNHRFLQDDVFEVLPRLARRGETFDAIVIDPPTFSRGTSRKVFRVAEDLPALLTMALGCAESGCHVLLSTNRRGMRQAGIENMVRGVCAGAHGIRALPPPPDIPPAHASVTMWFRVP
jgi:23S rRNA (cytosine1962-C5)-methyltransferase